MPGIEDHRLISADYNPSPNCDCRPDGTDISLLVIHNISLPPGEFGGEDIIRLFTNCLDCSAHPFYQQLEGLHVSSHLLIDREGGVTQFVPFDKRAWHAGVSEYQGRKNCNDFSIGIELEGTDDKAYTEQQYDQLAAVTTLLMQEYPEISQERIVGHQHIAPGRKTDPGAVFDWQWYYAAIST